MKKEKAGIKTLYGDFNLGNKLQNFAVVYNLEKVGFDVTTFQYRTKAKGSLIKVKNLFKSLKKRILSKLPFFHNQNIKEHINEKKKLEIFREFSHAYLNISKPMNKYSVDQEYIDNFDYIFIGSDQVWNEEFLDKEDLKYFLGIKDKPKKVGISASFGVSDISNKYIEIYQEGFSKMDFITVREEDGAGIVHRLTDNRPLVLVDPVMSLSKEKWREISEPPVWKLPETYILCYFLGEKTNYIEDIERLAQKNNSTIIDIRDRGSEHYLTGPVEFLYLIDNADLVCTDSFHGSAFSLIFNTSFRVFNRIDSYKNMSSRLSTLLDTFDCEHAVCNEADGNVFDWESINQRIEVKKDEFTQFIQFSIKDNKRNNYL